MREREADLCNPSVVVLFRYCELRRKAVLEHVYEGYDNDFWEFTE